MWCSGTHPAPPVWREQHPHWYHAAASNAVQCPAATSTGQSTVRSCIPCPAATVAAEPGANSGSNFTDCPKGTCPAACSTCCTKCCIPAFNGQQGSTSEASCVNCGAGTFSLGPYLLISSFSSVTCPARTFSQSSRHAPVTRPAASFTAIPPQHHSLPSRALCRPKPVVPAFFLSAMSARHLFHSGAGHQFPELPTAGCVSLARGLRPASLLALHAQSRPGLYQPVAVQRLPCRPVLEFQWVKSRASCDAGTWSSGEGARPPSTSLPASRALPEPISKHWIRRSERLP